MVPSLVGLIVLAKHERWPPRVVFIGIERELWALELVNSEAPHQKTDIGMDF